MGSGSGAAPAQPGPPKRAFPTRCTGKGGKRLFGLFPPRSVTPGSPASRAPGLRDGWKGVGSPPAKGFCWACNGSHGEAQGSFPSSISILPCPGNAVSSSDLPARSLPHTPPSIPGERVPRNLRAMPGPGQGWTEPPWGPEPLVPSGLDPGAEHQPQGGQCWWRRAGPHASAAPPGLQDGRASSRTFPAPAAHGTHQAGP